MLELLVRSGRTLKELAAGVPVYAQRKWQAHCSDELKCNVAAAAAQRLRAARPPLETI